MVSLASLVIWTLLESLLSKTYTMVIKSDFLTIIFILFFFTYFSICKSVVLIS